MNLGVLLGEGSQLPILQRPLLYCLPSPFFQILSKPSRPNLHPHRFLLPCFFDWMGYCIRFDVLFYLVILSIYKCWELVPEYQNDLLCFMQNGVKFTEVGHIIWFFTSTLTLYHTLKDTQHMQRLIDWHTYTIIY